MRVGKVLHLILALGTSGCLWVFDKGQPSGEAVAPDPARVARGRYLTEHVAACTTCHAETTDLRGMPHLSRTQGFPGEVWPGNLSPDPDTGIGNWTDGQVTRAIREGVDNNDEPLFPVMPYRQYRAMGDEDVRSIVAYLRSRPARRLQAPPRSLDFPLNLLVYAMPRALAGPVTPPDPRDRVRHGAYLASVAACVSCHSPEGHPEQAWKGGGRVVAPDGQVVRGGDLTPAATGGIADWTDEALAQALTRGVRPDGRVLSPAMPWPAYSGMASGDVEALVSYLRTIAPRRKGS